MLGCSKKICLHVTAALTQAACHTGRRKQREGRKFQKAVHAERLKEKAQSKKRGIENISRCPPA